MSIHLVTYSEITLSANILSTRLIIPLPICNTSLSYSIKNMHFPIILNSLNKTLKNDKDEDLNHSHVPPYISQENMISSLLSLLGLTLDPISCILIL